MSFTHHIAPGDTLSWRVWTGETATATVQLVDAYRISTDKPGIYFESTCFNTLDQALAGITVTPKAPAHNEPGQCPECGRVADVHAVDCSRNPVNVAYWGER